MGNLQGNLAAGVRLQRLAITTVIPTLGILFGLLLAELLQTSAPEVARQARERSRIRLLVKPSQLLVSSLMSGLELESPLWTLPLPSGTPRRLAEVVGHDTSWSPDQQHIVYAHGTDLYTAKSDGTEVRKLATVSGVLWFPRWSPKGKIVRFTVVDPAGASSIWEVGADGNNLHRLLEG